MADSVIVRIDGDDKGYQQALKNVESGIDKLNKTAKAVALSVGGAAAAIIGMGVKYNAEMEQYSAGFTTMLGSAEKADEVISNLKSFAEKTPFELTDLANASTTLLAFGEDVEKLMPDLKMLGDISLGNQEKFKSLALVFGQVQSQGKLMGQDLLQMINSGFNPLQVISEKTGESISSLKDKMSQGKISFEMVAEAMRVATSEGGQFYNAMEAQSKTLSGQWSTLKDNVTALTGEMSSSISGTLTETVMPMLIDKVEELKQAWTDGTLQNAIKNAVVVLVSFGSAVAALNLALFINDIYSLIKGVEEFTAATKAGTAAQAAFNTISSLNPYVMVAVALAALVGGIIAYKIATKDAITETEKINNAMADLETQTQENIKTIEDKRDETLADIAVTEQMFDRLLELDAELKTNSENTEENTDKKAELKSLVEQLNKVSPNFCLAVDNETGALINQSGAVRQLKDDYIELAKAKAYAEAYKEILTEKAKEGIKLEEAEEEAYYNYQKKVGKYRRAVTDPLASDAARIYNNVYGVYGIEGYKEAKETWEKASKAVAKNQQEQTDLAAKMQKKLEEADAIENKYGGDFSGNTKPKGSTISSTGTKSSTGKTKAKGETQAEIDRRNLEHSYNMGEISADEFYQRLAVIRDKYYKDGSREYQQISEEIYDYGKEKTETAAKEAQKAREEQIETEHRNLKYAHDMGIISDKKYYVSLAQHRDAYFTEGSAEWQQYTLEIAGYFDNLQQEAVDKINEIKQEQESLTNRIKGENGLYTEVTKSFYDKNGKLDLQVKNIELTDYTKETEELTQYLDSINALSERVDLPQEFFAEIRNLSTEEGAKFVNKLLSLSQGELEGYISSWDEYRKKASEFSKEMYSGELEELESELKSKFGEIPEDFFGFGEESAEQYTDGFLEYLSKNWEHVTKGIQSALGSISLNPSVLWAESGNNGAVVVQNTTNFNTTVNSNSTTLSQELEEANRTNVNIAERSGY